MSEWQPIETAPDATIEFSRDSVHSHSVDVLLWWGGEIVVGNRIKTRPIPHLRIYAKDEWASEKEIDPDGEPTHWMPLPSPPTSKGGE
jgi:hypothetical protein